MKEPKYTITIRQVTDGKRNPVRYSEYDVRGPKGTVAVAQRIFDDPQGLLAKEAALRDVHADADALNLDISSDEIEIVYVRGKA